MNLARELHDARITVTGDCPNRLELELVFDASDIRVVDGVERFGAELEVQSLPDAEVAEHPDVEDAKARALDRAALGCAGDWAVRLPQPQRRRCRTRDLRSTRSSCCES